MRKANRIEHLNGLSILKNPKIMVAGLFIVLAVYSCTSLVHTDDKTVKPRFILDIRTDTDLKPYAEYYPWREAYNGENRKVEDYGNGIYKIASRPDKGFNYEYYLFIPQTCDISKSHRLLLTTITTGYVDQPESMYSFYALQAMKNKNWEAKIAEKIGCPLVYPVIPDFSGVATLCFSRKAMTAVEEKYSRLDLQLVAMIEDAKSYLQEELNYSIKEKIFVCGFSGSGEVAKLFTAMYPEKVQAAVYGGISAVPILPFSMDTKRNYELNYPIGVADMARITGHQFDINSYLQVRQLIYDGDKDPIDLTIKHKFIYSEADQNWIYTVMGEDKTKRWNAYVALLAETCKNIQMVRYSDFAHKVSIIDSADFLKNNDEGDFRPVN